MGAANRQQAAVALRQPAMSAGDVIVGLVVGAALASGLTNGFHDAANAMASTIAGGIVDAA